MLFISLVLFRRMLAEDFDQAVGVHTRVLTRSESESGLQKPKNLEFQLDSTFADNFGQICRQIVYICGQFHYMVQLYV